VTIRLISLGWRLWRVGVLAVYGIARSSCHFRLDLGFLLIGFLSINEMCVLVGWASSEVFDVLMTFFCFRCR